MRISPIMGYDVNFGDKKPGFNKKVAAGVLGATLAAGGGGIAVDNHYQEKISQAQLQARTTGYDKGFFNGVKVQADSRYELMEIDRTLKNKLLKIQSDEYSLSIAKKKKANLATIQKLESSIEKRYEDLLNFCQSTSIKLEQKYKIKDSYRGVNDSYISESCSKYERMMREVDESGEKISDANNKKELDLAKQRFENDKLLAKKFYRDYIQAVARKLSSNLAFSTFIPKDNERIIRIISR